MNHRYAYRKQRKLEMVKFLGSQCVQCGSTQDLEFDHIDPSTKSFNITAGWTKPREIRFEELKKCQLLCRLCHIEKTRLEKQKFVHGTSTMYLKHKCRCDACRLHWNAYKREYRRLKRDIYETWKRTKQAN